MPALEDQADTYNEIHEYLLTNGQQELAGHLDALWQEAGRLQMLSTNITPIELGDPQSAQEFQDSAKNASLDIEDTTPTAENS